MPPNRIVGSKSHWCFENGNFERLEEVRPLFLRSKFEWADLSFVLDAIEVAIGNHIAYSEKNLYDISDREIYFYVSDRPYSNAFSSSIEGDPGFDVIAIDNSLIIKLLVTFCAILSHPNCFPEIGNAKLEDIKNLEGVKIPEFDTLEEIRYSIPICPIRGCFACSLVVMATELIFFHELTHLRYGHNDFKVPGYLNLTKPLIRQAMEMDADSGAIYHVIRTYFGASDHLMSEPRLSEIEHRCDQALTSTKQITLENILYVIFALCRLDSFKEWDIEGQAMQGHPQPSIRLHLFHVTVLSLLQERPEFGVSPDIAKELASKASGIGESHFAMLEQVEPELGPILSPYADIGASIEYLNSLTSTWNVIRPFLDELKRGGKLPR